jgi:peroxiredoxin
MAWHRIPRLFALVSAGLLAGCASPNTGPRGLPGAGRRMHVEVPDRAEDVVPIPVGAALPRLLLHTPEGDRFRVRRDTGKKPLLLIFYRGGWCPYCNRHLADLQGAEKRFVKLGVQILAISPDRPGKLKHTATKHKVGYRLLSDSGMGAARKLGLAFRLDDATVAKYRRSYKIDIEADSGYKHHQLPVPAAILVDRRGIVRFVHTDPDYKNRIDTRTLLDLARQIAG